MKYSLYTGGWTDEYRQKMKRRKIAEIKKQIADLRKQLDEMGENSE